MFPIDSCCSGIFRAYRTATCSYLPKKFKYYWWHELSKLATVLMILFCGGFGAFLPHIVFFSNKSRFSNRPVLPWLLKCLKHITGEKTFLDISKQGAFTKFIDTTTTITKPLICKSLISNIGFSQRCSVLQWESAFSVYQRSFGFKVIFVTPLSCIANLIVNFIWVRIWSKIRFVLSHHRKYLLFNNIWIRSYQN